MLFSLWIHTILNLPTPVFSPLFHFEISLVPDKLILNLHDSDENVLKKQKPF